MPGRWLALNGSRRRNRNEVNDMAKNVRSKSEAGWLARRKAIDFKPGLADVACEAREALAELNQDNRRSKSAQIPVHIFDACESEAKKRRKKTGKLIRWTDVLFEIAEQKLGIKGQQ